MKPIRLIALVLLSACGLLAWQWARAATCDGPPIDHDIEVATFNEQGDAVSTFCRGENGYAKLTILCTNPPVTPIPPMTSIYNWTGNVLSNDPPVYPDDPPQLPPDERRLNTSTASASLSANIQVKGITAAHPGCAAVAVDWNATKPFIVVGIQKLQYASPPGTTFVDITGTLFVLKGTQLDFKAVADPAGESFPSGMPVWSGDTGTPGTSATGTGETSSATFNTKSTSLTDYKTVIATCGTDVRQADFVVYELTPVFTPQDNFTGRSATKYGIAEKVDLSFAASPSITAAQAGGLRWSQDGGGLLANGETGTTGLDTFTAPEIPENTNFSLTILAGPSMGATIGATKSIIAPDGILLEKIGPAHQLKHTVGTASCGFRAYIYLRPTTVSFSRITYSEGNVHADLSGWFASFALLHASQPTDHPEFIFGAITGGNATTGSRVVNEDPIYGQFNPEPALPYANGVWIWDIPQRYRVGNGQWHVITSSVHRMEINGAGKLSISKKVNPSGAGPGPYHKNLHEPSSNW